MSETGSEIVSAQTSSSSPALAVQTVQMVQTAQMVQTESEAEKKVRWESQKTEDRALWASKTAGENLALGKPVLLIPKPDYRLTVKGDSDSMDLTDGLLTTAPWDRLWFDSRAVGWYYADGLERFVRLDLEREEPIERIVIRCLGGSGHNFRFPKQLEVWVSRDGETWFQAASMQKLMPCESAQADWETCFYLDENGETYETRAFPFDLKVQADARFLLLKITGSTASVFSDELVVLKAQDPQKTETFNAAYAGPEKAFPLDGLVISTRWPELGIVRGLEIPQHFQILDLRAEKSGTESETGAESGTAKGDGKEAHDSSKTEMILEVPSGVSISAGNSNEIPEPWRSVSVEKLEDGYFRYVYPLTEKNGTFALPTLYFSVDSSVESPDPARVYARCKGEAQYITQLPVRVVLLPEFEPFETIHVSLAWMGEKDARQWPGFWENYRRLGFNAVPTFPRYWAKEDSKIGPNLEFVAEARRQGFRIVMNESPLHVMMGGKSEGDEIFCQKPNQPGKNLCPTFRGETYAREMERVAQCVQRVRPDFVFFDIECWHTAQVSAQTCSRCQAEFQHAREAETELTLEQFLFRQGREITKNLKDAVVRGAEEAKISVPIVGSYNRQPVKPVYAIERFEETFPESVDLAMPSLYVAGREKDVHQNIRQNRQLLGSGQVIPWLSAGCYGEFEPEKLEFMVLETLLNGACGLTYYCYSDFDTPLDFYAHATALAELRPYEKLLVDGHALNVEGSPEQMLFSAWGTDSEMLLLIGNPDGAEPDVSVEIPLRKRNGKTQETCSFQLRDLRTGELNSTTDSVVGNTLRCTVPKGGIRLFYVY